MNRYFLKSCVLISLLFMTSCHFPAKSAMDGDNGRNAYNIEVQRTNAEEMLLNLVRLRYFDSPFFLEVSSVTSTFTYKNTASASIPIPGFNKSNPLLLGGESQWQTQPTIQYSPLEGEEFTTQLLQPLGASTIQQVLYSGWEVDRVLQIAVQDLKNFHNFTKEGNINLEEIQNYLNFYKSIQLMTDIQKKGCLKIGLTIKKHGEEKDKIQTLQLAFPCDNKESLEVAKLLGINVEMDGKYFANFIQGFDEKGNVGIMPRSILSCMYYLANYVQVPKCDIQNKKAYAIPENIFLDKHVNQVVKSIFNVYSSTQKPKDFYVCVRYRDKFFYIRDNDLDSKRTFMLLLELYNLQSGARKERGPILTLPIGVG